MLTSSVVLASGAFSVLASSVASASGAFSVLASSVASASGAFSVLASSVVLASGAFSVLTSSVDSASGAFSSVCLSTVPSFKLGFSVDNDGLSMLISLFSPSFTLFFDCASTEFSLVCSLAFASSANPNNNVAPTKIEAVPTVNFLIEYLLSLLEIKSIFPLPDFGFFFILHSS